MLPGYQQWTHASNKRRSAVAMETCTCTSGHRTIFFVSILSKNECEKCGDIRHHQVSFERLFVYSIVYYI